MSDLPMHSLIVLAVIYFAGILWVIGTSVAGAMIHSGALRPRPTSSVLCSAQRAFAVSVVSAAALIGFDGLLRAVGVA